MTYMQKLVTVEGEITYTARGPSCGLPALCFELCQIVPELLAECGAGTDEAHARGSRAATDHECQVQEPE